MPKDRKTRSLSFERQFHSPYPCRSSTHQKHCSSSSSRQSTEAAASEADLKEWEEAKCPVCMEHPHNAVLLLCSSHDKGCRPYMCDTSYRHSNCLDQFRKAFASAAPCPQNREGQDEVGKILCPLCRGVVKDWIVVEQARHYMNAKARICSLESCGYSGTYGDLRKHARTVHPSVRPSDADPERQRNWRRMECQRDIGDLLSTIRPLFIDDETAVPRNEDDADVFSSPGFFVYLMIIRLQHQEDVGATSHPQVFVTFGPRSQPSRNQRRRPHAQLGETSEDDVGFITDDNDCDEDLPSVGSSSSHQAHTGRRRRMRRPDEEDVF